jgi:hypothetical protein
MSQSDGRKPGDFEQQLCALAALVRVDGLTVEKPGQAGSTRKFKAPTSPEPGWYVQQGDQLFVCTKSGSCWMGPKKRAAHGDKRIAKTQERVRVELCENKRMERYWPLEAEELFAQNELEARRSDPLWEAPSEGAITSAAGMMVVNDPQELAVVMAGDDPSAVSKAQTG